LSSKAATTPATRLKTGTIIHALPTDLRCMSFHYTSVWSAVGPQAVRQVRSGGGSQHQLGAYRNI